jgi:hypothetical protein
MRFHTFAVTCLAGLLAGCGAASAPAEPEQKAAAGANNVRTEDLCVSNACGEKVELLDIPDAENLLFGPGGRLFVSGSRNVYEVTKSADGAFAARPLSAQECNFTGLTIQRNHLYASCSSGPFFAGKLDDQVALTQVFTFEGMCIPNGTAAGPDGRIYVVDEPLNCQEADPKIVALTIDPNDPMRVVQQDTWIQGSPTGLLWLNVDTVFRFPNGLVRDGNTFYGTDGGTVYSVGVGDDGSAGTVTPLFFEPTAHDDLGLAGDDGLVVTDFFKGRILLLSRDGELLQQTDPGTFVEPSSVRLGQPPMFAPTDVLVTDKGIITDESLPIDKLWLFRRKPG